MHDFLAVLCHNPGAASTTAPPGANPLAGIPGMPPSQQAPPPTAQQQPTTRYLTLAGVNQSQTRQETLKAQAQE